MLDEKVALIMMKLSHLSVQKDRDAYLRGLVDLCSQAVDAERCTVYVVDKRKQELRARVAQRTATEIRLEEGAKVMINVGSIGQPRDENPNPVVCVYDTDEGVVRLTRVRYDIEKAGQKIKKAGLPEVLAERLKYGR